MKNISIVLLYFVFLFGACKSTKPATEKVVVDLPTIQSIGSEGRENIRFHFEPSLTITLVPESGIRKVNENGDLVLLSLPTVKFPSEKLGKFFSPSDGNLTKKGSEFEIVFEEENEELLENGKPTLRVEYNTSDSLRLVIVPDGEFKGKPVVFYQAAKYYLPDGFKEIKIVVGEVKNRKVKIVPGVAKPGKNAS